MRFSTRNARPTPHSRKPHVRLSQPATIRVGDHARDVRLDRDVADHGERLTPGGLDPAHRLPRRLLVDVRDDEAGALRGEHLGGLAADAHPRAGDQRGLASQSLSHVGPLGAGPIETRSP